MLKSSTLIAVTALFGLSACLQNDAERALVGAGVGCVAGNTLGNNNCVEGALAGGLIGALANDL
uniref:glycine zipper 2TM domain-containing protein n=1 Tax=Yoonia sp. TaxID=2212373 RepID=UPI0040478746|tara:strand:+ start:324 stop:515 length:192 start_codon:yes stop_codon:yes gene_type:complete